MSKSCNKKGPIDAALLDLNAGTPRINVRNRR